MRRPKPTTLILTAALMLTALPALAQEKAPKTVVGSWVVDVTVPPGVSGCPPEGDSCVIVALATASSDGTVVQTAALPGVSTGHGIWRKEGRRRFLVRSTYFRFGANGLPIGTSVTVTTLDLARDGATGVGTFVNTLFAADGTFEGTFSGEATATRLQF
jgi:hypothetical protein